MEVVEGDLWDFYDQGRYVVVPTNLTVRQDGTAVMGRGVALQAAQRFPRLARWYGTKLRAGDYFTVFHEQRLIMFPVKDGWWERADLELIRESCDALRATAVRLCRTECFQAVLPFVGCGFGELSEEQVLPFLKEHLPQPYFVLVRRGAGVKERYPDAFVPSVRRDAS